MTDIPDGATRRLIAKVDLFLLLLAALLAGVSQLEFFLCPRTWSSGLHQGMLLAMSAVALVFSVRNLFPWLHR